MDSLFFGLSSLATLSAFPLLLMGIVIANRYVFGGSLLWLRRRSTPLPAATAQEQPTVCIIMPLYNEGPDVMSSIETFQQQDYPAHLLSFIIVDDRSNDQSANYVALALQDEPRGRLIRNTVNMGKRLGLVKAVRQTAADIVVSVDSDVRLMPNAISELVSRFVHDDIAAVGGRVGVTNANENWLTMMQTIKYYIGYEFLKNLENSFGQVMCLSGCLTAYRRSVLVEMESRLVSRRLGLVRIKYGEDRYLTRQIVQSGYRTHLHTGALCFTKVPAKLSGFFAQQMRWRRSNIVDFVASLAHLQAIEPAVALHTFTLSCLLVIYPVWVLIHILTGYTGVMFLLHLGILGLLAFHYRISTSDLPSRFRVSPVSFLAMCCVMPVTYLLFSPLALFTLDTGSWETRKKAG